ncbi:MAG: extracellular solute-binding protein [Candidatus Omnitrophota bacterium]
MKFKLQFSVNKWLKCGLIFVLTICLAGCSQSKELCTLTLTMSLAEHEWKVFRERIFPPFEKEHNVKIHAYQIESGQLATKLEALEAAGKQKIDLFAQDNMSLALLINKGLVLDLSEYESRIPQQTLPNLVTSCKFNARLMFMPFRPNVQIVYYNSEAFEKYNLQIPATWEELLDVARKFKEQEGEGRVLLKAFGGNPTATQIYEFVLQAGGDPYHFDDAGCIAAFKFLQELWPYVSEESRRAKWDTTNEILGQQQAYLAQNWPFGIAILIQEYQLPFIKTYSGWAGPQGEYHVIGGDCFGIPKNSRQKTLALEFIRYVQSKDVQEILLSELGWPSIREDVVAQVETWQKPYFEAVQEALRHGVFRKNATWWPAYAKYISEAFREIVIEKAPVEETLKIYKEKLRKEKSLYDE